MDATDLVDRIRSDLEAEPDGNLRAVTRYDGFDFETRMREDVRGPYTEDEDREIVDDTIVDQPGLARTEASFRAGALQGAVRAFEDALVVSWPDAVDRKSGVIVSLQRDGNAWTEVGAVLNYLEESVRPIVE